MHDGCQAGAVVSNLDRTSAVLQNLHMHQLTLGGNFISSRTHSLIGLRVPALMSTMLGGKSVLGNGNAVSGMILVVAVPA